MLNSTSSNPRFYQLYADLRDRIQAGEFQPSMPIPSQQQLMDIYRVSLITVRRALELLSTEGYITREHGRGCFVTPQSNWMRNRRLASQIGIIVSSLPNSFFPEIIAGVESFLTERNMQLVIAHSRWDPDLEQVQISRFLEQGCSGLLISPSQAASKYLALQATGVRFVFINHYHEDARFNYVITDDRDGARQAGMHLLELGHRKIGMIIGGRGKQTAIDREEGLRESMKQGGIQTDDSWIYRAETFTYEEGRTGLASLLHLHPDLTAIFCSSEMLAVGAAAELARMGRSIPGDVSLVAFGDSDTAKFFRIPLTTVHQPTGEMGKQASAMLWDLIHDRQPKASRIRLPCQLVVRQSTAPARTDV